MLLNREIAIYTSVRIRKRKIFGRLLSYIEANIVAERVPVFMNRFSIRTGGIHFPEVYRSFFYASEDHLNPTISKEAATASGP